MRTDAGGGGEISKLNKAYLRIKHMSVGHSTYFFERVQCFSVNFRNEVGFCNSIVILSDWVNIYKAVVSDLNSLEVREKPANNFKHTSLMLVSDSFCIYNNLSVI